MRRRGGDIELAKQGRIVLDEANDDVDEGIDALFLQVISDAAKRAAAVYLVDSGVIRGKRRGNHMLAEAVILERAAGAFTVDVPAVPPEFRPVIFRACDLRQHALWLDGKYLNLTVTMIGLAAREYFPAGEFT